MLSAMNVFHVLVAAVLLAAIHPSMAAAQTNGLARRGSRLVAPAIPVSPTVADRRIGLRLNTYQLLTNVVVATVDTGSEVPQEIACIVKPLGSYPASGPELLAGLNSPTGGIASATARREANQALMERLDRRHAEEQADWQQARWMPFTNSLTIDLGAGAGRRMIWIAAKWSNGSVSATGTHVRVHLTPPLIVITNPTTRVTSRPMIQLQGYSELPLQSIRYDVFNGSQQVTNQQGFVNEQEMDCITVELTTNYFSCCDIDLAPGTNTIVLRCQDLAGRTATNVLTYVFSLEGAKTPPILSLDWPANGDKINGESFTIRGRLDNETARINAVVSGAGQTNSCQGLVERNGHFWIEDLPLRPGENQVAITAIDAAGNSASTNLVVFKSDDILTIDPIPEDQLWRPTVSVSGKVGPGNADVWVNGVKAELKANGVWIAQKVPVRSPNGGTAVFDVSSVPRTGAGAGATPNRPPASQGDQLLSVAAGLGTNAFTLNAGQPACGRFDLHLSGTAGRPFILFASTNLTDWTPILTNLTARDTYEFTDTNATAASCRFFRVMPLR